MTRRPDPAALSQIIELSRWVGNPQRDLAILAEGNTSVKVGDGLLVKASGANLATAGAGDFVEVDPAPLRALIADGSADDDGVADALRDATSWGDRRPSVEVLLHVVCQEHDAVSAVVHAHPTAVNALLCSIRAAELVNGSYFPDQIVVLGRNPLLIPYFDPGLTLAHRAVGILASHVAQTGTLPKIIYLQNHGIFALGGSVTEAKQIVEMAVKTARVVLGALSVGGVGALSAEHIGRIDTRPDELFRRAELGTVSSRRR